MRLAGLHGRSDVRSKVYSKYPELRKKADFGTWVRSNRNNNVLANLLYESGIVDKEAWRNMLRDIHQFTGMGGNPYNTDENVDSENQVLFSVCIIFVLHKRIFIIISKRKKGILLRREKHSDMMIVFIRVV